MRGNYRSRWTLGESIERSVIAVAVGSARIEPARLPAHGGQVIDGTQKSRGSSTKDGPTIETRHLDLLLHARVCYSSPHEHVRRTTELGTQRFPVARAAIGGLEA